MSFDHWAAFVLGTYQETRIGWRSHKVVMKPHKLRVLANDLDVFLLEPREGGLRVAEGGGQQQRHEKEDERGQINKFDSGMEATWQQQLVVMCLSYGGVDVKLDFVCLIERICNLDIQRLIAGWCSNMCGVLGLLLLFLLLLLLLGLSTASKEGDREYVCVCVYDPAKQANKTKTKKKTRTHAHTHTHTHAHTHIHARTHKGARAHMYERYL